MSSAEIGDLVRDMQIGREGDEISQRLETLGGRRRAERRDRGARDGETGAKRADDAESRRGGGVERRAAAFD